MASESVGVPGSAATQATRSLRPPIFGATAAALILFMAALAGGAAWRESVTMDELAHTGAGVSYLQRFDMRFNPEHPPLAKVIAALPLVARRVRADYASVEWSISKEAFPAWLGRWVFGEHLVMRWNNPKSTLALARAPMLLLTLVLGLVACAWARRIGGDAGGLLCLTVFVSTPALLAFGPLVLTHIGVTLFSVLALWAFAKSGGPPSPLAYQEFMGMPMDSRPVFIDAAAHPAHIAKVIIAGERYVAEARAKSK